MKQLILLIDDEIVPMKYFVIALEEAGYEVCQLKGPDEFIAYSSDKKSRRPDCIILDTMMPPGKIFRKRRDCELGARTGLLLYPMIQNMYPDIACIVLTNITKSREGFSKINPEMCIIDKGECAPDELVTNVNEAIKHTKPAQHNQ